MVKLRMVPGTIELFDAELAGDTQELARLLEVEAIAEWPPIGGDHDARAVEFFRSRLSADPLLSGWGAFYVCAESTLVGSAGFMGRPVDGTAEIGYSICERYRGRGFATLAVSALVRRAAKAGVRRVIAHTRPSNVGSIIVLERNDFALVDADADGRLLFARTTDGAGITPNT